MTIILDENNITDSQNNEKQTNCNTSTKCNTMKYMILIIVIATILIGSTYVITKSFYQTNNIDPNHKYNSNTKITDNSDEHQLNYLINNYQKDIMQFKRSLLSQLHRPMFISDFFFDEPLINNHIFHKHSLTTNDKNEYILTIEIPGFTKEQITIDMIGHSLVINADNKDQANLKQFKHSSTLPSDIDTANITSVLKNGILIIYIPRMDPKKQSITISPD